MHKLGMKQKFNTHCNGAVGATLLKWMGSNPYSVTRLLKKTNPGHAIRETFKREAQIGNLLKN